MLQLKLCGVAAVVASAPYWLYQIWAFIVPGLHANEKKWSRVVAAIAGPLFFGGVALGYYVLPKGLAVLIAFVPDDVQNLVDFGAYFSFVTRMLLIFGVAMEIPFFVILLNLAGVISGKALGRYRPVDRDRSLRLRRRRHAVDRPVLDADAGRPVADPLHRRGDRGAAGRPGPRAGQNSTNQWNDDEASPI